MNFRAVLNIRALSNIRDEVQATAEVADSGLLSLRLDGQWDLTLSVGGNLAAADPAASTPLLSALAQARGVPLDGLVRRVLAKADAFAVASGSIIGQRQALEDRLDACMTLEEVQGITVDISMPGGGEA